jgi:hypothetical protein
LTATSGCSGFTKRRAWLDLVPDRASAEAFFCLVSRVALAAGAFFGVGLAVVTLSLRPETWGFGSSVRVTGDDVDSTPEMQQVSARFGGTPVFRAHIAFGPFDPGHE